MSLNQESRVQGSRVLREQGSRVQGAGEAGYRPEKKEQGAGYRVQVEGATVVTAGVPCVAAALLPGYSSAFRVEELGEARVVGHVDEVGVGVGLDAVGGIDLDGAAEMLERIFSLLRSCC